MTQYALVLILLMASGQKGSVVVHFDSYRLCAEALKVLTDQVAKHNSEPGDPIKWYVAECRPFRRAPKGTSG